MENKNISKWSSRRWIISIWSIALLSVIVIWGLILKEEIYGTIALALVAIPTSFVSLESVKKWKIKGEGEVENDKGTVAN